MANTSPPWMPPAETAPWMPPAGEVELRIFHAQGYDSVNVLGEHCLTAASGARFDYARVRELRVIDWSSGIDAEGFAHHHWDWKRDA